MTRHVEHLLAAYLIGQLGQSQARRVYLHLAECPRCQAKVVRIEDLDRRLRATLSLEPVASISDVHRWWQAIQLGQPANVSRREYQVFASMALATIIVLVPMVATWSNVMPPARPEQTSIGQSTELTQDIMTFGLSDENYLAPRQASELIALRATAPPVLPISAAPVPFASSNR